MQFWKELFAKSMMSLSTFLITVHLRLASAVFRERGTSKLLQLAGIRNETRHGWVSFFIHNSIPKETFLNEKCLEIFIPLYFGK